MSELVNTYKRIEESIDNLLSLANTNTNVKFIYHGYYDCEFVKVESEFSGFLLSDLVNQKMKIVDDFKHVIEFLNLSNDKIIELKNNVNELINEEKILCKILHKNNITMDKYYSRKLFILSSMINV